MASHLQKLVRKQSLTKTLISNLNRRILSSPTRLLDPKPEPPVVPIPFFDSLPGKTDESNPNPLSSTVYPSFSFDALLLHPISQIRYSQSVLPEEEIVSSDEDRVIWADSVKKKRKKKMNKHKLKKLRKRLRRKT